MNTKALDGPDFELIRVRTSLIELVKSFFAKKPDGELIASWRGALSAMSTPGAPPPLVRAASELLQLLHTSELKDLRDEFYELFTDPFSKNHVITNVCYYLDGKNFGASFIRLKEILQDAALEKDSKASGSEDELPIVLDAYQQLIEFERKQNGLERGRELQSRLLKEILYPFSRSFKETLGANSRARFYRLAASLMEEVLNLETSLFP